MAGEDELESSRPSELSFEGYHHLETRDREDTLNRDVAFLSENELRAALIKERIRSSRWKEKYMDARKWQCQVGAEAEREEEYKLNRLLSRLNAMKAEKEAVLIEVEQEEELLTNSLQKKIRSILQEKAAMENQMEAEQEFIVNRLNKQLAQAKSEKDELESKLVIARSREWCGGLSDVSEATGLSCSHRDLMLSRGVIDVSSRDPMETPHLMVMEARIQQLDEIENFVEHWMLTHRVSFFPLTTEGGEIGEERQQREAFDQKECQPGSSSLEADSHSLTSYSPLICTFRKDLLDKLHTSKNCLLKDLNKAAGVLNQQRNYSN